MPGHQESPVRSLPRHDARRRAVELLYQADLRREDPRRSLERAVTDDDEGARDAFVHELVEGVATHLARLDEVLGEFSHGWAVSRMAAVDRNILRLGTYELLYGEVPTGVAISEAVELATLLSTDRSPRFVNGVLSAVARRLVPAPDDGEE